MFRELGSEPRVQIVGGQHDGAVGVLLDDAEVDEGFVAVELDGGPVVMVPEKACAPFARELGS